MGGGLLLGSFWKKKRLLFLCVVFCLGFYKKIQNPKHIYVSKKASLSFLFFVFFSPFVFSFLVGLFMSTRDRRAHFRRRRKRRRRGSSRRSTPRAHQRKNQGFPQTTRDHTHHTHALEEEEEEEDFESTTLSWCLFSSLIIHSFEREGIGGTVRSKACDDTKCGRRRLLLEKSRKKTTTKARKETTLFLITARRRWTSTQKKTTKRRRRRRKRFLRACWLPRN